METVFDHNITTLEWNRIRKMEKEEYLKMVSPNTALFDLAALFYYRGKRKKAEKYINQIESVNTRTTFWRIVTHQ